MSFLGYETIKKLIWIDLYDVNSGNLNSQKDPKSEAFSMTTQYNNKTIKKTRNNNKTQYRSQGFARRKTDSYNEYDNSTYKFY